MTNDFKPFGSAMTKIQKRQANKRISTKHWSGKAHPAGRQKDYQISEKEFTSINDFLRRWSSAHKKLAIIQELAKEGVFFDALADKIGRDSTDFLPNFEGFQFYTCSSRP
jgi:hypothetical protein